MIRGGQRGQSAGRRVELEYKKENGSKYNMLANVQRVYKEKWDVQNPEMHKRQSRLGIEDPSLKEMGPKG